jgi:hypothetical protein
MLSKIILILSLLLLSGCTAKIQELQQKSEDIRSGAVDVEKTEEEKEEENAPAVEDMGLDEIEDELENMDEVDVEADLDEIDKEL